MTQRRLLLIFKLPIKNNPESNAVPILHSAGTAKGFRGSARDITERKRAEEERENLISELQQARSKVKMLSGLFPRCASCK